MVSSRGSLSNPSPCPRDSRLLSWMDTRRRCVARCCRWWQLSCRQASQRYDPSTSNRGLEKVALHSLSHWRSSRFLAVRRDVPPSTPTVPSPRPYSGNVCSRLSVPSSCLALGARFIFVRTRPRAMRNSSSRDPFSRPCWPVTSSNSPWISFRSSSNSFHRMSSSSQKKSMHTNFRCRWTGMVAI